MTGPRPLLVYDGDCGFCTACVEAIRRRIRPDVDFEPWQWLDLPALGLAEPQVVRSVWWIDRADGTRGGRAAGAAAFARVLLRAGRPWRALGHLLLLPPFAWCAAAAYRLIAVNRHRLPGATPTCRVPR